MEAGAPLETTEDHVNKVLGVRAEAGLGEGPADGAEVDGSVHLDGPFHFGQIQVGLLIWDDTVIFFSNVRSVDHRSARAP